MPIHSKPASLISYRLGLQGNNLPFPSEQDYLIVPAGAQEMIISDAKNKEIKLCIKSLMYETFGIELAEKPAYQVNYDRGVGILLFNQEIASREGVGLLTDRKTLLGLFADKVEESGTYSASYLIFTSPGRQPNQIHIQITNPVGLLVFGGIAEIDSDQMAFSIRAISQLGIFPLVIEGFFMAGKLQITTAKFSTTIQNRNQLQELDKHATFETLNLFSKK